MQKIIWIQFLRGDFKLNTILKFSIKIIILIVSIRLLCKSLLIERNKKNNKIVVVGGVG